LKLGHPSLISTVEDLRGKIATFSTHDAVNLLVEIVSS